MFKLFKNLRFKDIFLFLIVVILIVSQVFLELEIPSYMSKITSLLQTDSSNLKLILSHGSMMVLYSFGSLILAFIASFIIAEISSVFSAKIRSLVFEKVHDFSMGEIKKYSVGSLITRTTNDVAQIDFFLSMGIQMLIKAPVMAYIAFRKIMYKNIYWLLVLAGIILFLTLLLLVVVLVILPRFKKLQKFIDKISILTRESIKGVRVIRAFNAEKFITERFSKVNNEVTELQIFTQKAVLMLVPIIMFILNISTIIIYLVGAYLIDAAVFTTKISLFSDMVVFSSYSMQIIMSYIMLAVIFIFLPRAEVSARRINEVLEEVPNVKDGNLDELEEIKDISFENVSFMYPDAEENVITNISFDVKRGETLALIGTTGSGKSTIINLIPRLFDVSSGKILINGVNIKNYNTKVLRERLAYVPQKAFIFNESIKNNLQFGSADKLSNKELEKAIDVSKSTNFAGDLGKIISEGGTNLSGGQKQRLSIARAIARKPDVYIFDDTFSALDYKTDSELRKNLREISKDSIMIIVAQRVGTIMNADKIMLIDKGKCIASGTHKELLKSSKVYKNIALSQLSEEDLNEK